MHSFLFNFSEWVFSRVVLLSGQLDRCLNSLLNYGCLSLSRSMGWLLVLFPEGIYCPLRLAWISVCIPSINVPPVIYWSYAAEALTFSTWHTLGGVHYSHTTEMGECVSVLLLFFSLPVESSDVTLHFPNGLLVQLPTVKQLINRKMENVGPLLNDAGHKRWG